jgi:hypothetical protein
MVPLIPAWESADDEVRFAARMTMSQFAALAVRLEIDAVVRETEAILHCRQMSASASCEPTTVARWLINGWSTEYLLCINQAAFAETDALRHSLHWTFPQAYYCVFSVALGYFKAVGFPEIAHKAVLRKFAQEIVDGKYPRAMAFAVSGGKADAFSGLRATSLPTSITFRPDDLDLVDGQIAQYLRATRMHDLKAKKQDLKLKTKKGARKKSLRQADWEEVSHKMGPTALLHLLYRKRIKANYHDIETFLHPVMNPHAMYAHLLAVVDAVNFVHEAFVVTVMGSAFVRDTLHRLPEHSRKRVMARLARMNWPPT